MTEQSTAPGQLHGPQSMPSSGMDEKVIPQCLQDRNLEKIAKELGKDGKSLGRQLGFSEGELQCFKNDNKDNLKEEIISMLTAYINTKAHGDPVMELLKALKEIERMDLYTKLQNAAEESGDHK
ncbi:uncharacterized protein LOC119731611 isoform X1 [Patiria miniata]|uniref:Death domain-containing protein n=1 Tax=Patiria miniata TaxID=46514 RepID=A0A914AA57_PATMI|nr:uncharacterized protein LOC119731611 isoform X1 [Patiria miniata]